MSDPFPFFGDNTTTVDVYEDGFIRMNPCLVPNPFCPSFGWQYLNLLERDLEWRAIEPGPRSPEGQSPADDETGPQVHVYTVRFDFQWFIISTQGIADYDPNHRVRLRLSRLPTWLNYETGEIRFCMIGAQRRRRLDQRSMTTPPRRAMSPSATAGKWRAAWAVAPPAQQTRIYDVMWTRSSRA
jgi:hypothetical protein